ncbi:MAG: C4-type zinc ribbon domain-containing protein [Anaeromicrobium sp.]|jgi:predicted  nucleic acid-binding Zn-ribbon protein|uniref:zinc ribbon domain-containing protein n=1 Tax=Anaeromicrobium sp. TaxID=1929132 RepID=UPI0025D76006|nr:C4-type zinc ribbon domain-containing protein [Anaeromicrobium sp.]MCT4594571.1 C4-type zinc ribbon domain-containing protein [Anaeromicrobium sp.]
MVKYLFELQEIEMNILKKERELEGIDKAEEIKKYIMEDKKVRKHIEKIKCLKKKYKTESKLLEDHIKDIEKTKEEMKKKLYGGEIKDSKGLELLMEKEKRLETSIDTYTERMVEKIESQEKVEMELEKYVKKAKDMGARINELLKERKSKKEIVEENLHNLEREREDIKRIIPKGNLELYYTIKKKKVKPMAYAHNQICSGCHMDLPIEIMEKINKGNMKLCPNCRRIVVILGQ